MVKFIFNKLIREKIIEQMTSAGVQVGNVKLDSKKYLEALGEKLLEEALEVKEALIDMNLNDLQEELADVYEVIQAIYKQTETLFSEIEKQRLNKLEQRGSFFNNTYVEYVEFDEKNPKFQDKLHYFRANKNKYTEVE